MWIEAKECVAAVRRCGDNTSCQRLLLETVADQGESESEVSSLSPLQLRNFAVGKVRRGLPAWRAFAQRGRGGSFMQLIFEFLS